MKLLSSVYKDAGYEVRLKAGVIFYVQLVGLLTMVLSCVFRFSIGEIGPAIAFILSSAAFGISLMLLMRGKFDQSSMIFSAVLFLAVVGQTFFRPHAVEGAYIRFAMFLVLLSLITSYLVRSERYLLSYIICAALSFISFVVMTVLKGGFHADGSSLTEQIVMISVIFVISLFLIISEKKLFNNVTADALQKFEESEVHSKRMISLVSSVSKQIDRAEGLKEASEETGMAVTLIEKRIGNIMKALENLDEGYASTSVALQAIGDSLEDLKGNAQNQSAHVSESSAAIEEMVAAIRSLSKNIQDRKQSVVSLMDTSRGGEEVMQETESSFASVMEQIGSIRDMTSLISGIAARTNLLAMNAAIEAAHAGDAGRGFAVVADEIRKLAESSSGNAKKISENLNLMIDSIETTGTRVKQSGDSFREIRQEVDRVSRVMDDIHAGMEELSTGSAEILNSTTNLNELTVSVMDSVNKVDGDKKTIDGNLTRNTELAHEVGSVSAEIKKDAAEIKISSDRVLETAASLAAQSGDLKKAIV